MLGWTTTRGGSPLKGLVTQLRYLACLMFITSQSWGQSGPPMIDPNGVLNGATGTSSSSVPVAARGSIVFIRGSNLSGTTASADRFPLPVQLGGTQVRMGGIPTPLVSVTPTQLTVQVPFEIPNVSMVDLVVQNAIGVSAPLNVTVVAQDPGSFGAVDLAGRTINESNPVVPGQTFVVFATGLGVVAPPVPSGNPGPQNPFSITAIVPVVYVGDRTATVSYTGLAPGDVRYQINATAPTDLPRPTSNIRLASGVLPGVIGPPGPAGAPGP